MTKRLILFFTLVVGLCVSAFAEEEKETVVSTQETTVLQQPSEEEILVEAYANNFETLCFLYKKPGRCSACDRARADLRRLEEDGYPITYVYCDDPDNEELVDLWEVEKVPTFVTVRHLKNGEAEEHSRFSTPFGLYNRISFMYKERLDFDPNKPHRPRPGVLPPPRPVPQPKPFPGVRPKPGDPKPFPDEPKPKPKKEVRWYAPWTWF